MNNFGARRSSKDKLLIETLVGVVNWDLLRRNNTSGVTEILS